MKLASEDGDSVEVAPKGEPGDADLEVRQGHLGVEGLISKCEFDRKISLRLSVFSFDPNQIVSCAGSAKDFGESWLNTLGHHRLAVSRRVDPSDPS
jgi:hypothetical protein